MKEPEAKQLVARLQQIRELNAKDTGASTANINNIPKQEFADLVELTEWGYKVLFRDHELLPQPHECTRCYLCNTWTVDERAHRCPVIEL